MVEDVHAEDSSAEELAEYLKNLDSEGGCDLNEIIGLTDEETSIDISVQDMEGKPCSMRQQIFANCADNISSKER